MNRVFALGVCASLLFSSACSKVAGPSSATSAGTAVINGSVVAGSGGGAGSGSSTGPSVNGVIVSIGGTGIRSTIDAAGQFVLRDVPGGDVGLVFSGSGVSAGLTVSQVQASQVVDLRITLTSTSAHVDSDTRSASSGHQDELDGPVEALPPVTAVGTFVVAGKTVTTNSSTVFRRGGDAATFADLRLGMRVQVKGQAGPSTFLAQRVSLHIDDDDDDEDEAELDGTLTARTGTAPLLTLTVGGRTVRTTSATIVRRRDETLTLGALVIGMILEVEGRLEPDNSITARKIKIEDEVDDDEDDDEDEVELEGAISAPTGTCPAIRFTIGTIVVNTSAQTEFRTSCAGLIAGNRVEVKGKRQVNGSVLATRVSR